LYNATFSEGTAMPIVLGIDLGTTTITALAVDAENGAVLASSTSPNDAETTPAQLKAAGYSEWDARRIAVKALETLSAAGRQVGERRSELAGIGITGQQHGVVLVDRELAPLIPLINWQDRRAEQVNPRTGTTYVRDAANRLGPEAASRTGCRLAAGYMAVTLFWMEQTGRLPRPATACFLMDFFAAYLTGQLPVTDPTCAASSGILNLTEAAWDGESISRLGLVPELFPSVRPSGHPLGGLTRSLAEKTGLPAGLPVFGGIGDNQASFLGSVARPADSILINVGTGAQVTAYRDCLVYEPHLETRPFPRGGWLLVSAGLCGGASYAFLERFFRDIGSQLFSAKIPEPLYPTMNRLAADVPSGADGLRCEPYFTGTRLQPELRASWTGVSSVNFTPGHWIKALLEGLGRSLHSGYGSIQEIDYQPLSDLVGSGNGLRENSVLRQIISQAFAADLHLPAHREEAAFGAALMAATGAGIYPDLAAAGRIIRYEQYS
jgi:sugar (pentulose or hexulose) kinase